MLTTPAAGPMAQAAFQSPPPPPTSPTWPSAVDGETTSATDDGSVDPFTDWPWWWWAAGGGGVLVVIIIIIIVVCACCCCCRRRKRRRRPSQGGSAGDAEIHTPPADFRRMESSAAKRYLHNIASVFSWGSDFEGEGSNHPGRPSSNVIYSNSTTQSRDNIYANTQQLQIPATGAGPSSPPSWKSDQLYGNVG